ncbi:TAXI family TRAP transporter solute-binding subunit [Nevskia soli]|uniref:TAXI family TRAP transporter solute-binding subunit n=1 Tax=Nevskia soli TaxID=418856 RepID=UPI000A917D49|nr:TAXI family TRAP transporter solute-binding subunit [Nevskia soli]
MTEPNENKPRMDLPGLSLLRKIPPIPRISWRDLAVTLGPVLLLSVAAILLALHFVRPAPPSSLTISAGPAGSRFQTVAESYRKILAASGINLVIKPSKGSLENLEQLINPDSGVDVAFVQSGLTVDGDTSDLVSLGGVFYQPLTVFYRGPKPLTLLSELEGKRIAIGSEGSGTRTLALAMLKANGIDAKGKTKLLDLEGEPAVKALDARHVDAIFLSGDSASTGSIRQMLHTDGVRLFDFPQADAYVRRFPYLSKLSLPPGSFDLGDNLPSAPISMLAPTVELVARSDLHPALSDLLIDAAQKVNGKASLLQSAGEFPSALHHEFPLSDDAARYYKSGKSFAYRFLPFWLASLLDRAIAVLVPIIVVLVPGLRIVPALYGWRINNRIYRRYGELMALERAVLEPMSDEEKEALVARLGEIEKGIIGTKMPGAYANQIYVLRQHIKFVRDQLTASGTVEAPSHPPPNPI